MHVEQLAARMLTVGFQGKAVGPELARLLRRGVGGVILFARNVGDAEQVRRLVAEIKSHAPSFVLVSVDQEGGPVQRLIRGFTRLPAMRQLGSTQSEELARRVGDLVGQELSAVGIDVNFAPVLDVDSNPDNPVIAERAFSSAPELVARLGCAYIAGLQGRGIAACAKHFPGHGDTTEDSHTALPVVHHDRQHIEQIELVPFRAAVTAGVACVMTAHVVYDSLDARMPATLSQPVLSLLRKQLGFEGLVISDDLEMQAITQHFDFKEALGEAVRAGVDHFLCCHAYERSHLAIDHLTSLVQEGKLSIAQLEQAAARHARLVNKLGHAKNPPAEGFLGSAEHRARADRLLSDISAVAANEKW